MNTPEEKAQELYISALQTYSSIEGSQKVKEELASIIRENQELKQQVEAFIDKSNPMNDESGDTELAADSLAMQLVGARHEKRDLVNLVRALLIERDVAKREAEELRKGVHHVNQLDKALQTAKAEHILQLAAKPTWDDVNKEISRANSIKEDLQNVTQQYNTLRDKAYMLLLWFPRETAEKYGIEDDYDEVQQLVSLERQLPNV